MIHRFCHLLLISVFAAGATFLPEAVFADDNSHPHPKICLVLKGGGALGFAHVGVLNVLEENRIPIHCIAGTSMGSIVGAAYATGNSLETINKVSLETDWDSLFKEDPSRSNLDYRLKPGRDRELFGNAKLSFGKDGLRAPGGLIEGQHIQPFFQELFGHPLTPISFDSLPIPFRAVAANIETGEPYIPNSGSLVDIVRASMSVPGAFSPVLIDDMLLVDGGIAKNLPVDTALGMGADILIVVDLRYDLSRRKDLTTPISITGQMINLLLVQNSKIQRKLVRPQDYVIEPNMTGYSAVDFTIGKAAIALGEEAARDILPKFAHLALSEDEYNSYQAARLKKVSPGFVIEFIDIKNDSVTPDARIESMLHSSPGDTFDAQTWEHDVVQLHDSGRFERVKYSPVTRNGKKGVELEVKKKRWLDSFVRLGFSLEDDFSGDNSYRLGAAYRKTGITNSESYVEAQGEIGKQQSFRLELYQPISDASPFFFVPAISLRQTDIPLRVDGDIAVEYERLEGTAELLFGAELDSFGELTAGVKRGFGDLERKIGSAFFPDFSYDIGEYLIHLRTDTLDTPDFPTSGYSFDVGFDSSIDELGGSSSFERLSANLGLPYSWGRNTAIFRAGTGQTLTGDAEERIYTLGGFLNVSGFQQNSLAADDFSIGQLVYFRRFSEVSNPIFDLGFFLGGTFEGTNIHNRKSIVDDESLILSGSVFIGADTPILPAYFGFGLSDENEHSFYLTLGRLGSRQ